MPSQQQMSDERVRACLDEHGFVLTYRTTPLTDSTMLISVRHSNTDIHNKFKELERGIQPGANTARLQQYPQLTSIWPPRQLQNEQVESPLSGLPNRPLA
jgi:hypothetical protein